MINDWREKLDQEVVTFLLADRRSPSRYCIINYAILQKSAVVLLWALKYTASFFKEARTSVAGCKKMWRRLEEKINREKINLCHSRHQRKFFPPKKKSKWRRVSQTVRVKSEIYCQDFHWLSNKTRCIANSCRVHSWKRN